MKNVTLTELLDFKVNYLDKFYTRDYEVWTSRILVECSNNRELLEEIKTYLTINNDNTDSIKLDYYLSNLRERTNYYLNIARKSDSLEMSFNYVSLAMIYFGLLESIDELGSFAIELIDKIKSKYHDNYLSVIQSVDKAYLSVDSKKVMEENEKIDVEDDLLRKYIILKKWQDEQHLYFYENIVPYAFKVEEEYMNKYPIDMEEVGFEYSSLHKLYVSLMSKKIIHIDDLAKAYLSGINKELVKLIGGKGYGLTVLRASGANIPMTYVVSTCVTKTGDYDSSILPQDICYSVRSSADIEDGNNNSFAGMFDSYLNVKYDDLNENIIKVVSSKNNSRLQKYIETNNLNQPNMAVVIQTFVEPEYAGVWIGKTSNSGVLEYVEGNGEKLVSGKVTPSREIWKDRTCSSETLKTKNGSIGEQLLELQAIVAKEGNGLADFEWMILNGELVMLQYRPVTSDIDLEQIASVSEEFTSSGKPIFHGIAASPGVVRARARFVNAREIDKVTDWQEGDILMAWFTDPEWMNILSKSSGIVTAVGGFLCHSAIVARELGIPCVIGIGSNMKKLWGETNVTIDGNKGIVYGNSEN
jgi:pyruvate,water dikinase